MMMTEKDARGIEFAYSGIKIGLGAKCAECGPRWELEDEGRVTQRPVIWKHRCIEGGLQIGRNESSLEVLREFLSELHTHI